MDDISKLAEILRNNGDKVLNNESKLTIPLTLFNQLNSSFNLISEQRDVMSSSFNVVNNASFKADQFCDLQFLSDFIERSPSLKLTPNSNNELVDISKCKSLKLLEIYKINVKFVLGIANLRKSLQFLVCVRGLNLLKDVLEKCGADESEQPEIWKELREATFTHNNIQIIDNSIDYIPWLMSLDLSHNHIETADILSCMSNLKYLNLSYNKLSKVPNFSGQICNRLQVMVLCNNFIENVHGVMQLTNLCELDLSENCLIEHNSLIPVAHLATLQWLNLKENPLSYHPQHRSRVCCYLHMNTNTVKFILDQVPLNCIEHQLIGSLHPKHLLQKPLMQSPAESLTASISQVSERNRRVRYANIADDNVPPELEEVESIATLFTLPEPMETKKQLESLHKDYMKSLYSKSLDIDLQMSCPLSSTPYESDLLQSSDSNVNEVVVAESTTYITASDSIEKCEEPSEIYSNKAEVEADEPSDDEELESGESNIFVATVRGSNDDIIVIITKTHLTEKDPVMMKGLGRFSLDALIKCERIVENDVQYIYIEFNTLRTDRSRYYRLADDERERFYERLKGIFDNRPLETDIFTVYRCMKCSMQFAVEKQKSMHQKEVKCLSCDSDLVVEDDS